MSRPLTAALLCALLAMACSSQQAPLVTSSTTGGMTGSTTIGTNTSSTSSGIGTGGTSGGQAPVTVTLEQMEDVNCSDGACGSTIGGGDAWTSPYGASLRLATRDAGFAASDFDCPLVAVTEGSCCMAEASAFPTAGSDGCSGSVQAVVAGPAGPEVLDGSVEAGTTGCEAETPDSFSNTGPTAVAGTTQDGIQWAANVTVPDDYFHYSYDGPSIDCPTLSLTDGGTSFWQPTATASIHVLILDAQFDAGPVLRIACNSPDVAGTVSVSASLLASFAGSTSVKVTNHSLIELVFDAGNTPIDVRAETTLNHYLHGSDQSLFGPCTVSP